MASRVAHRPPGRRDDALDFGGSDGSGGYGGGSAPERTPRRAYARGVAVDVLNPKVALFFVAFLPEFAGSGAGVTARMLVLGVLVGLEE